MAFHSRFSPDTVYARFFSSKPTLSASEVERFTHVEHDDRVALIAELGDRLVGVARYARVRKLTTIRSIYRWQGEIHDRPEARAGVHTRTALVPRIIERLDTEHPYQVPAVFALPIIATSPAYRAWMLDQTAQA